MNWLPLALPVEAATDSQNRATARVVASNQPTTVAHMELYQ